MKDLPRFEISGEAHADTQAGTELSLPSASWSGYPAPNADELIGQTLNETYIVESVIGEGGMGRVYRASHTRISNKRFAIKVLRPEFTRNTEVLARFRREAEAAACIAHPNVVEVYDVDVTHDGYSYLVCEYLAGLDLADYLTKYGRLEPLRAVNLALQVCHALESAHDSGVIHRDVKPHNIFLIANDEGSLPEFPATKVLDFGLSRFMDAGGTQLTRAGVIMGTPSYMSPEQAEGKGVDARTDVYGLGAVLFAALAGRAPYEADSLQAVILAVINGTPEQLRRLVPDVPESLEFIVERAMARNCDERYPNMQAFRSALEGYLAKARAGVNPSTVPMRLPAPSILQEPDDDEIGSARPKLVGYGALLTLLVVLGLTTCVASLEVATGPLNLSRLELVLLFSGILGTLATPALLLLGKVRRTVWTSHAKVFALLFRLRAAALTAVFAYGGTALVLLVADDVAGRFTRTSLIGNTSGLGFRGFNAVFFAIALTWVTTSLYLTAKFPKGRKRRQAALAIATGCVVTGAFIAAGLAVRSHWSRRVAVAAEAPQRVAVTAAATAAATSPVAAKAETTKRKPLRAPDVELARATVKGSAGLLPLSERYPEDPNVLRPLFYDFASRATGLADAMTIAKRLLQVSPEDAQDSDLRYLVRKAAASPGGPSRLALEILTDDMGPVGADLLYDLWTSEPKVAKTAEALLLAPSMKEKYSPALAIAMDLRRADSCAARVPLLERAAGLGDRRSVAILSPLSAGSKRGCGRWKRNPCPAACAEDARAYYQAITKILERQPTAR